MKFRAAALKCLVSSVPKTIGWLELKNNSMKKYQLSNECERIREVREKHDELQLFQDLLRCCPNLNELYNGKALEIANGLQPWIDALKMNL